METVRQLATFLGTHSTSSIESTLVSNALLDTSFVNRAKVSVLSAITLKTRAEFAKKPQKQNRLPKEGGRGGGGGGGDKGKSLVDPMCIKLITEQGLSLCHVTEQHLTYRFIRPAEKMVSHTPQTTRENVNDWKSKTITCKAREHS